MENKKILAGVLATTILAAGISASFADDEQTSTGDNTKVERFGKMFGGDDFGMKGKGFGAGLTDDEKTALESMTDEEKQEFFETKREEQKAEMDAQRADREAKEAVIDKLLAGETLTDDEEDLRSEIITERAERKAEMETRQAEMEEIRTIMEKQKAGEELSDDEQAKLDEMKGNFGDKRGGMKGGKRGMDR